MAEIAAGTHNASYDLTGDGLVDLADRDTWLAEAGFLNLPSGNAYRLGDANLDGVVDGSDFNLWNSNKFTTVAAWSRGDFNADGIVDGSDFNIWNSNKFTSALAGNRVTSRQAIDSANSAANRKDGQDADRLNEEEQLRHLEMILELLASERFRPAQIAAPGNE